MAEMLVNHDQQVRQNERLETLVLMSSGVAHNLRNSVTGCKMAVDLLSDKQTGDESAEEIQVARRQLEKMSHYIDRFLSLAKSNSDTPETSTIPIELAEVLHSVSVLTSPHAKHLNVTFEATCNTDFVHFQIGRSDAEQVMSNLINNAIDAASEQASQNLSDTAFVRAELIVDDDQRIDFVVTDSGAGPPSEISDSLHLPFVTGKKAGTGLGLSLVHDIASRIGGKLDWCRDSNQTRFVFTFSFGNEKQS
jgi:signal transduction histidine kinase